MGTFKIVQYNDKHAATIRGGVELSPENKFVRIYFSKAISDIK